MISTQVVAVNCDIANLYLTMEHKPELGVPGTNRPRNWRIMQDYARAMLRDQWRLTHQGIAFKGSLKNHTAELADGGHRLDAVIYAATVGFPDEELPARPDITVSFMVTDGLTEEDMLAMDIGFKRTPGHFMSMNGEASTALLAAIVKLTWVYMNNLMDTYDGRRKTPMTPVEQREHLEKYPDLRLAVHEGARLNKIMTASAVGAFWFLAINSGHDQESVKDFLDDLFHGEHMGNGDPAFMLRELMINSRKTHRGWETHQQLALLIKAFLKFVSGEQIKQLVFRIDEKFPKL